MKEGTDRKEKLKKLFGRTIGSTDNSISHRKHDITSISKEREGTKNRSAGLKAVLIQESQPIQKKLNTVIIGAKQNWRNLYTQKLPFLIYARFWKSHYYAYKKYLIPISIGMLIVLAPVIWLSINNPDKVRADWFDDNWHYRKKINITNTGAADSNKKVLFETDTSALISESKMQNTCADARFTDVNGQVLSYFIDSTAGACNTISTDFYILLPTINAGDTVIYFYYANTYVGAGAETSQFSQATFSPSGSSTGTETVGPGPVVNWKFDEAYDQKENTKIEQQLEIMTGNQYTTSTYTSQIPIEITYGGSANLTDYQIPFSFSYQSGMNADFSNIRFYNSSGSTKLSYWIESKTDSTTASVWVKVPTIAASATTTIYLRYGNPDFTSESSAADTFTSNTIQLLTSACPSANANCNQTDSHTEFDTVASSVQNLTSGFGLYGSGTVTLVNHSSNPYGSSDNYFSRYRFLFIADTTGTHGFLVNSDDASELGVRDPLDTDTSHTVPAYWYGGHGNAGTCATSGTTGTRSINSGEGVWLDYRMEEVGSGQLAQLCVQEPSGSYAVVSTTNFPGQLFSRNVLTTGTEPSVSVGAAQQANYVPGPSDNSLGIISYNTSLYSSVSSVNLEIVASVDNGTTWSKYRTTETSNYLPSSTYTVRARARTSPTDTPRAGLYDTTSNTEVLTLDFGSTSNTTIMVKAARLIIAQESGVGITQTETKTEIGSYESSTQENYTPQTDKKIYNYDSTKYNPTPTNYFEATAKATLDSVGIEQQINILDGPFYTGSTTYVPTDNSLGLVYWDADKYPGAIAYLEVDYYEGCCSDPYVSVYTEAGSLVTEFQLGLGDYAYHRYRSTALTLTDNTAYTVRWKASGATQPHTLLAARFIVIQTNATKITDTQTQVEVGGKEEHTNSTYAQLDNPKTYYYDSSKFSPAPTTYFETTAKTQQPTIEQQINITNGTYATNSSSYLPTDNSLGLVYWDADKYPGATVYFEIDYYEAGNGGGPTAAVYTEGGALVTALLSDLGDNAYHRNRSSAITLTDNTAYTVRWKTGNTAYSPTLLAARFIVIQTNATKITDTQTQVEVGGKEEHTNSTYAQLDNPKTYYYDSSKFSPAPTTYFETTAKTQQPTIEQQINITNGTYATNSSSYLPTDNSLGLVYWDADKYPGATVYFEIDYYEAGNGGGPTAAVYTEGGALVTALLSDLGDNAYHRNRSSAITLTDNTAYTVRWKTGNTAYSPTLLAARFIVIQTNATKITDTQTQVEVGGNETTTATSYTNLTNKKIWRYDSSKFSPAPTAYFEAVISNDTAGQTTYAALYTDGATCSSQVSGSEVSTTGTTWSRVRSSGISLTDGTDYTVCVKASANTAKIANSKIVLEQTDATNGIRAVELYQMQVNSLLTDADATYSSSYRYTSFNPGINPTQSSFEGGTFTYYYEATMKTSAGTGYATLYNATSGTAITGGEITTASTTYSRVRSGDITANMPYGPSSLSQAQDMDTQAKNSATNTTSLASSWVIIQVSNLSNVTNTIYAELYNLTDGVSVTGSEVSTATANTTTRLRSPSITLTTGKEYVVRTKTSSTSAVPYYVYNSKIVLEQTDATNGIRAVELIHTYNTSALTDTDATYSQINYHQYYTYANFAGGNFAYLFESDIKTSAGTGYARLYNISTGAAVTNSEVTTASASITRVRSSDLTPYMPLTANTLDVQIKNSATNTTTSTNSSLIIQVSNLGDPEIHTALYPNGTSCTNQVTSSTITYVPSDGIKRAVSQSLSLSDGEYMMCTESVNGVTITTYNAKINHQQSAAQGITNLRTFRSLNTDLETEATATYARKNGLNSYDPAQFTGTVTGSFETTLLATATTAYAQLYNVTSSETIAGTETSTASTSYVRLQKSITTLPSSNSTLDIQIKNSSTNITKTTASWLVLDIENILPAIVHDSTSNKLNGQLEGTTWESEQNCISGSCLEFDGVDDYVKVTDNPKLDFAASDNFTISMWFTQPYSTTGNKALISKYESVGSDGGYQIKIDTNGKVVVEISDDNTTFPKDSVTSSVSYRDSKWHHVAAVKNGTTSLLLYVDGVLEGTDSTIATAGSLANNDLLYVGDANDGTTTNWLGHIDETKIYRYARSAQEIENELYGTSPGGATSLGTNVVAKINNGLLAQWKMEETTANSCGVGTTDGCDSTSNGYNGYWEGNAASSPGKFGNSLVFDGNGDALRVTPEGAKLSGTSLTSRIPITFDNSSATEDLTNFPILVKLNSSRISYSKTQDLGQDIRFTDSDGSTLLNYEIEKWDETGDSYVWVMVPNIPSGSTTDLIYMYFNDTSLSDGQNATGVWNSNYVVAQHMKETSGTTTYDSTSNGKNGTKLSATEPNPTTSGQINGAQNFDGSNDYITLSSSVSGSIDQITVSAWVYSDTLDEASSYRGIVSEVFSGDGNVEFELYLSGASHYLSAGFYTGTWKTLSDTVTFPQNQWVYVSATYDGHYIKLYKNSTLVNTSTDLNTALPNGANGWRIGKRHDSGNPGDMWDGTIDEVRISNTPRSASWVGASYKSGADTLNTYGTEQSYTPEFNVSNQVSVSGWYYPTTLDATTKYLTYGSGTTKSMYIKTDSANAGKLLYSSNGTDEGASSTTLSTNNWYYITLTGNSTETKLYINGKLDSTVTNTTGVSDLKSFYVGNNNSLSTNGFIGKTDEVKLYNTVLAASEIAGSYDSPKSPVAYYTFDQKSTTGVFDISTNNNSGTWAGSTTSRYTTGKFGSAGVFDGSTDYVSTSDTPFDITTDFTLESWVNLGTAGSAPYNIVSKHGVAASGGYALFVDANGAVNCLTDNGTTETVSKTANSAVTSSSGWIHVAAVREGTSCKVYINTEDRTSTAGTHATLSANALTLRLGSNTSGAGFFKGSMDEVKIYDYAVTPKSLLIDYNAGHPIPGSPVGSAKGWWKMDEGYDATAHNTGSSGSANDGTITGAAWSLEGKYDRALDFDGTSDYVTVATGEIIDQNTITIEAWIYPTSVTGAHDFTIFAQNDNAAGYSTHNFGISGSTGKLLYDNELPAGGALNSNTVLTASQWQHVTVVRDTNTVTFYLNGESDGGGTGEARSSAAAIDNTLIGARYYSGTPQHQFAGKIDDVKVYNVALTASQVAQAYNRAKAMSFGALSTDSSGRPLNTAKSAFCVPGDASTCNAPVADYNFDEKQGSSINDVSGNGKVGTLENTPAWANGNIGGAVEFNGTDNYATISSGELVAQDAISVEAWIYPGKVTDASNVFTIFAQNDTASGNATHLFGIDNTNGKLFYDNIAPAGGAINSDTALVANTWNHVAFTRNGTSVTFYLNGKSDGAGTGETRQSSADIDNTLIGARYYSAAPQHKFIGRISGLTVFNYARTAPQIAWDHNKGGPSLWWKLDDCQGLVAQDSSGNNYDGTISIGATGTNTTEGSCSSGVATQAWNNGTTGKINGSLHVDGTNDYISIGTAPSAYSVSLWVKPSSTTQSIVDLDGGTHTISVSAGTISAGGFSTPTIYVDGYQTTTLSNTNWHQITVVTSTPFNTGTITLGKIGTAYFTGQLDEFKLYSYPLTPTQVRNNYAEGVAVFN